MAKTQEVPAYIREFNKLFEEFTVRHDWGRSYADFLQWVTTVFSMRVESINGEWLDRRHEEAIRRYSDKERQLLQPMLHAMTVAMANHQEVSGWADALGTYYEIISNSHKSSHLGQFFTPAAVCEMTAKMQFADIPRAIINDPACGSGRLLLAHHANGPQNRGYYVGGDIDTICVDMTAINMMMQGVEGEVIEMDTLRMEFRRGWRINPWLYSLDIVCMVPILHKRDCYAFGGNPLMFGEWRERVQQMNADKESVEMPVAKTAPAPPKKFDSQLKLFDL